MVKQKLKREGEKDDAQLLEIHDQKQAKKEMDMI